MKPLAPTLLAAALALASAAPSDLPAILPATLPTTLPASPPFAAPSTDAQALTAGRLPTSYRDWKLISVAREEGAQNDIRAVLGNDLAFRAYRDHIRPFPDGAVVARLAWEFIPSEDNNRAFGQSQSHVAGDPKNGVQFMLKSASQYPATGGWRYFQFTAGKPLADPVKLQACFTCHQAVSDAPHDFLFTHYSP